MGVCTMPLMAVYTVTQLARQKTGEPNDTDTSNSSSSNNHSVRRFLPKEMAIFCILIPTFLCLQIWPRSDSASMWPMRSMWLWLPVLCMNFCFPQKQIKKEKASAAFFRNTNGRIELKINDWKVFFKRLVRFDLRIGEDSFSNRTWTWALCYWLTFCTYYIFYHTNSKKCEMLCSPTLSFCSP